MEKIDKLDRQILNIISKNARIPFKDVAEECGVSRAAIHQRVQRMIDMNVIVGSGYHINPKILGYNTCTDGQDRIYTHGEKEVAAEKDRKENGIPVNDNTMVELADLCSYLKLDFGSYFEGYELPKDSKFFNGNY